MFSTLTEESARARFKFLHQTSFIQKKHFAKQAWKCATSKLLFSFLKFLLKTN